MPLWHPWGVARPVTAKWRRGGTGATRGQSGAGRTAVDLGRGAGADALALAGRGWVVTAVDRDPVALSVLREQVRGGGLVEIVHASFAEAVLPEAHLVHAGYSLPFCAPADSPGCGRRFVMLLCRVGCSPGSSSGRVTGGLGRTV
jgi:hypothetical protein